MAGCCSLTFDLIGHKTGGHQCQHDDGHEQHFTRGCSCFFALGKAGAAKSGTGDAGDDRPRVNLGRLRRWRFGAP
jgi:hypothetical protein